MELSKEWPIIGLNYKDEPLQAQAWLQQWGNPYQRLISDPHGQLGLDLGVYGAPETYLLDQQRTIRLRHAGILTQEVWQNRFLPAIAELSP
jgi:cytochrome c biogenesis protein CcmG/thiol:disulfide interchange protein DsbE